MHTKVWGVATAKGKIVCRTENCVAGENGHGNYDPERLRKGMGMARIAHRRHCCEVLQP